MKVVGTAAAERVVERVRQQRRGTLTFTIGGGCCESTAPFLFEDHWVSPHQWSPVGEIAGVPVLAPAELTALYPGEQGWTMDVVNDPISDSMSIETDLGARFILVAPGR